MSEEKAIQVSTFAYWKLLEAGVSEEDKEMWKDIKDVADSVKSLESRMAEYHDANQKRHFRIVELEQRLSQAEADLEGAWATAKVLNDSLALEKDKTKAMANEELKARLSHLMDVAGKMAVALENCHGTLGDSRIGLWEYMEGTEIYGDFDKAKAIAKLALAEWDGIKK